MPESTIRSIRDMTPEERRTRVSQIIARSRETRARVAGGRPQASAANPRAIAAPAVKRGARKPVDQVLAESRALRERIAARSAPLAQAERRDLADEHARTLESTRAHHAARAAAGRLGRADPLAVLPEARMDARLTQIERALAQNAAAARINGEARRTGPDAESRQRAEYRKAFHALLRRDDAAPLQRFNAAYRRDSDPDGGFFVPAEISTEIDSILSSIVAMRGLATVRNITRAVYKHPINLHGTASGWVGETSSRPETASSTFGEMEFPAMEQYAMPAVTQSYLDDATDIDVEAFIAEEVSTAFSDQEGGAFITGDGVGKPRGVLSYPFVANTSWVHGKVGFIATGVSGDWPATAPADKLIDLVHALKSPLRANASWLMNNLMLSEVRKLKDTTNQYLWQPGTRDGMPSTLLSYPVAEDDGMPDKAANSYSIAFGDFKRAYVIVDRSGIRVIRDIFTQKPYILLYHTRRVGGGIKNFEAVKTLKFAA